MDGMIQFNGVLGILAFFATVGVLAFIALVSLVVRLLSGKNKPQWPKHLLLSSVILLVFDGIFFLLVFLPTTVWSQEDGKAFDNKMLLIWIPCHIVGFFLAAGAFHFIGPRKERIDAYIEKLR